MNKAQKQKAIELIKQMREQGIIAKDQAAELNKAKIPSYTGTKWTRAQVSYFSVNIAKLPKQRNRRDSGPRKPRGVSGNKLLMDVMTSNLADDTKVYVVKKIAGDL